MDQKIQEIFEETCMYPADYEPDGRECGCGQSSPLCALCRAERGETMSQADEDEMWYFSGGFDDMDPDPPYWGPVSSYRSPRRVTVDLPGTIELQDLEPGETFKFPNAVNAENVYMVISSNNPDLDDQVEYVLMNKGQVYSSRPTKRVFQVDVRIALDPKRKRGRV